MVIPADKNNQPFQTGKHNASAEEYTIKPSRKNTSQKRIKAATRKNLVSRYEVDARTSCEDKKTSTKHYQIEALRLGIAASANPALQNSTENPPGSSCNHNDGQWCPDGEAREWAMANLDRATGKRYVNFVLTGKFQSVKKKSRKFSKFATLPTELQIMIWEQALLHPRVVRIAHDLHRGWSVTSMPHWMLSTCTLSRSIVLENFHRQRQSITSPLCNKTLYLNMKIDTLFICNTDPEQLGYSVTHLPKSLALQIIRLQLPLRDRFVENGGMFVARAVARLKNLQDLTFIMGNCTEDRDFVGDLAAYQTLVQREIGVIWKCYNADPAPKVRIQLVDYVWAKKLRIGGLKWI